ncbi:MAG: hypothetical protein AAFP13_06560 [Pseudomonadota bacterium]
MADQQDFETEFARHRGPLLILSTLVVSTLCACLVMLSTTSLTAKPEVRKRGADTTVGTPGPVIR